MFGANAYGEVGHSQITALWFGTAGQVSVGVTPLLGGTTGLAQFGNVEASLLFAGSTFAGGVGIAPYTSLAAQAAISISSLVGGAAAPARAIVAAVFGVPGFGVASYAPPAAAGTPIPLNARATLAWSAVPALRAQSSFEATTAISVSTDVAFRAVPTLWTVSTVGVEVTADLRVPVVFAAQPTVSVSTTPRLSTLPVPLIRYARSNYCRSRGTRSDYYLPNLWVQVGDDVITSGDEAHPGIATVWKKTLRVDTVLNEQVDTASFTTSGFDPKPGQTVIIGAGALDNRIFAGTIQRVRQRSVKNWHRKIYDVDCTDWTWSLNKRRAFATYLAGTSISAAAADLVTRYAPTFSTARIQAGGPPLLGDMAFRGTPVMDALQELTQQAAPAWHCYPDYNKVVHFFDIEVEQQQVPRPLALGNLGYDNLDYALDLTQIQTRVIGCGGGGQTLEPVAAGATTIPINECGWYSYTGGMAVNGADIFSYASVRAYALNLDGTYTTSNPFTDSTTPQGPGALVGVTGFTWPALADTTLNVFVDVLDGPAASALALLMGGGDDGLREGFVNDGRLSEATIYGAAQAQLNAFKNLDIRGSYHTYDKLTKVGQKIMIALPARGINQPVTLQRVSRALAAPGRWEFTAEFAIVWSDLIDILADTIASNREKNMARA